MGFTTAILTAASAVPGVLQAAALNRQSKQLNQAADLQSRLDEQQASAMQDVALENQRRSTRNAQAEIGHARADAAASGLASQGSVTVRERDLATRLSDSIANSTNEQLQQVNSLRAQSAYNNWDLRNRASQAKAGSLSSLLGGVSAGLSTYATRSSSLNAQNEARANARNGR